MEEKEESGILYWGENIDFLLEFKDNYFDCECIDPPFNSDESYTHFIDKWGSYSKHDMELNALRLKNESLYLYLKSMIDRKSRIFCTFMAYRLIQMHRILAPHGILMLVCDDHEGNHIGELVERIFGPENYVQTIRYRRSHSKIRKSNTKRRKALNQNVGTIICYAKNADLYRFHDDGLYRPLNTKKVNGQKSEYEIKYPHIDPNGIRFKNQVIQDLGKPHEFHGVMRGWNRNLKRLQSELEEGRITAHVNGEYVVIRDGNHLREIDRDHPKKRFYCIEYPKFFDGLPYTAFDNLWEDVRREQIANKESGGNTGCKTEELMDRLLGLVPIVPEGEDRPVRVLDCFSGCGTTLVIAQRKGYEWVGMEKQRSAVDSTLKRFNETPEPKDESLDEEEQEPWDRRPKELDLFSILKEPPPEPEPPPKLEFKWTEPTKYDIDVRTELLPEHKGHNRENLDFWHALQAEIKSIDRFHEGSLRSFPKGILYRIWRKQNYTCQSCNIGLFHYSLDGDHIIAWSRGGATTEENCQILCSTCNRQKSTMTQEDWMEKRSRQNYHTYNKDAESQKVIDHYNRIGKSDIL